jgi:chromosome segregation ATPase
MAALTVLDEATADEEDNAGRPDSLLSDIKRSQPRLRSRVNGVRAQYRQLRRSLSSLRDEIEEAGEAGADVADMRQRLAWVLMALRHQRARESDLIYEAYRDAFDADLGHDTVGPG